MSFLRNSSTSVCLFPFSLLLFFLKVWNKDLSICYLRKTGSAHLMDKTKRSAWHQMSHVASSEVPNFPCVGANKDLCNVNMTGWYKGKILKYDIVHSIVLPVHLCIAFPSVKHTLGCHAFPMKLVVVEAELYAVILQRLLQACPKGRRAVTAAL